MIRGTTTFSPGGRAVEKAARNAALLVAAVACEAMAARLARGWATARKNMAVGGVGAFFGVWGGAWFSLSGERVLQIPNQLHFFTKIGDFLHARCKKSLLDVKNLPVD